MVAFPNLRSHGQTTGKPHAEAVTGEQRQVRYLYPRYWQVETESPEFQVSAQAVRRAEPTWNWRRLDPLTFRKTDKCARECAAHSLERSEESSSHHSLPHQRHQDSQPPRCTARRRGYSALSNTGTGHFHTELFVKKETGERDPRHARTRPLPVPAEPRLTPEVKLALNPRPLPEASVKNQTTTALVVE